MTSLEFVSVSVTALRACIIGLVSMCDCCLLASGDRTDGLPHSTGPLTPTILGGWLRQDQLTTLLLSISTQHSQIFLIAALPPSPAPSGAGGALDD